MLIVVLVLFNFSHQLLTYADFQLSLFLRKKFYCPTTIRLCFIPILLVSTVIYWSRQQQEIKT
jgi:hypothetical protein